jgi:hypothetical protein
MMTSNQELRKEGKAKDVASDAGMQLLCKVASCNARLAVLASISGLVDKAAVARQGLLFL